jgi:hypothetical protein
MKKPKIGSRWVNSADRLSGVMEDVWQNDEGTWCFRIQFDKDKGSLTGFLTDLPDSGFRKVKKRKGDVKALPGVGQPVFAHEADDPEEIFLGHYEGHDLYYSSEDYGKARARYSDHPWEIASTTGFQSGDDFALFAKVEPETSNKHMRACWVAQQIANAMGFKPED